MASTRVEITRPVGQVDRAMDAYVAWRNECIAVRDAYRGWAAAHGTNAALAFQAYSAALDREELASEVRRPDPTKKRSPACRRGVISPSSPPSR
jgi:hypothetical protein